MSIPGTVVRTRYYQRGCSFFILLEISWTIIFDSLWTGNSADYWAKDSGINMKKQHLDDNIATTVCLRVWANSYEGESPTDLINEFQEDGIIAVESEEDISIIVNLLMNAHNNTRMKENRGHKPTELAHDFRNGFPTIVPGSTQAANMLREAMPELSKMGIPIDFNSNADTVPVMGFPNGIMGDAVVSEKKIYPNDPCPCGSGKKYKKCCGKK